MEKPPCVRGLTQFKKGCPETCWDRETGEGCPGWTEIPMTTPDEPGKIVMQKKCFEFVVLDYLLAIARNTEATQQAIESFRNNMSSEDGNPKPDPAGLALVGLLNKQMENQRLIYDYEVRKMIDSKVEPNND